MFNAQDYLYATALGSAIYLLALSPIVFAVIVAWLPGQRPDRKWMFSITCGVLAYGSIFLVEILLLPFDMVATFLAPSWEDAGYTVIPNAFAFVARHSFWLSALAGVVVAIGAPFFLRRTIWPKIVKDAA